MEKIDELIERLREMARQRWAVLSDALTRLQAEKAELERLLTKADNAILYLTMHHNSNPDYVKGFDLAHEYMALRNHAARQAEPQE